MRVLIGVGTAFVAACIADLRGSSETRTFTRAGFFAVAAHGMGLTLPGLVSWVAGVIA